MLTVVCWKWKPLNPDFRSKFDATHVNTLYRMVERNYAKPFRLVCITDDPSGIEDRIETFPLWDTYRTVPSPLGLDYPACYARLVAFHPDFARIVGERFVSIDLDTVIVGDVTELWDREEDFVIWENNTFKNWLPGQTLAPDAETVVTPYNGSMWMMTPGARREVYDDFDPVHSPIKTHNAQLVGSDQAWIFYRLGPKEATWTKDDGVYAWRSHLRNRNYRLPTECRIVFFQGNEDPWTASAKKKAPWIVEHYC